MEAAVGTHLVKALLDGLPAVLSRKRRPLSARLRPITESGTRMDINLDASRHGCFLITCLRIVVNS
jgi:hypothetical protein